jgi:hypothetical protein
LTGTGLVTFANDDLFDLQVVGRGAEVWCHEWLV